MQPSPQALADGRRWEGYSLVVYPDSLRLATQGIGRHHGVNFGDPAITDAIASLWFAQDWQGGYVGARSLFPDIDVVDQVRREALIWLVFNMGVSTLSEFVPFIHYVNAKDWDAAAYHVQVNMSGHLTPYLGQVGARAVETGLRIATGEILESFACTQSTGASP